MKKLAVGLAYWSIFRRRIAALGLKKIRLLTNNPKKTDAFIYGGFDLEETDQVPIVCSPNEFNEKYLAAKRDKMGHKLP